MLLDLSLWLQRSVGGGRAGGRATVVAEEGWGLCWRGFSADSELPSSREDAAWLEEEGGAAAAAADPIPDQSRVGKGMVSGERR